MDEWVNHIAKSVGCDTQVARLSVGHVLGFLQKRFPNGPADELIDKIAGARNAIAEAQATQSRGGLVSGVLGGVSGLMGGAKGDVLALSAKLTAMGLSADQLKRIALEIFGGAENVIGRPKLRTMTDTIPGLSKFLWPND